MKLTEEERAVIMMYRSGEFRVRLEAKDSSLSEEAAAIALAPLVTATGETILHLNLDRSDVYEVGGADWIHAVVATRKSEVQADADA